MTSDDIKYMQIMLVGKNGEHLVAKTESDMLIRMIVSTCQFVELKNGVFEEVPISEYVKQQKE